MANDFTHGIPKDYEFNVREFYITVGSDDVPISFGKYYSKEEIPMLEDETHHGYEARTWMNRCHTDKNGAIVFPMVGAKHAVQFAADILDWNIPGKGRAKYKKNLLSGVQPAADFMRFVNADGVPFTLDNIRGQWLFVPSDGKKGGSKRVEKCFPMIDPPWRTTLKFVVYDPFVTDRVFLHHVVVAGVQSGFGRYRPQNGGHLGAFKIFDVKLVNTGDSYTRMIA